jgi:hypothetical protein
VASTFPAASGLSKSVPSKRTEPGETCKLSEHVVVQFETACETTPPLVASSFTDCTDELAAAVRRVAFDAVAPITTVTLTAALEDRLPGSAEGLELPPPPPQAESNSAAQEVIKSVTTLLEDCLPVLTRSPSEVVNLQCSESALIRMQASAVMEW